MVEEPMEELAGSDMPGEKASKKKPPKGKKRGVRNKELGLRGEAALVFVEVKTRSSYEKGLPGEAVNKEKRRRYEKIAAAFLSQYEVVDVPLRFDVVSIVAVAPDRAMIRHHINAFAAA